MVALEVVCLCLIAALCYLCTRSDLRHGMIYNKVLAVFLLLAIALDAVYYGFFVQDLFYDFTVNVLVVAVASLYLFFSHSFAGGDCKMMIVVALLFPARFYWVFGNSNITLVFTIAFAIFAGYCYLLISSIWAIATKKVVITVDYVKGYLLNFLKSYITAMIYISLLQGVDFEFTNNNVVYSGSMQGVYTDGEVQLMLLITPGKMPFAIGVNISLTKK